MLLLLRDRGGPVLRRRGRHGGALPLSVLALRFRAQPGTPWGALLLGAASLLAGLVALLRLDRLPISVCVFKALTGLPCPSCGSTRAAAALARLDVAGALALNPLLVMGVVALLSWGLADLALLVRGRALTADVGKPLASTFRVAFVLAVLVNWGYLIAAGL